MAARKILTGPHHETEHHCYLVENGSVYVGSLSCKLIKYGLSSNPFPRGSRESTSLDSS